MDQIDDDKTQDCPENKDDVISVAPDVEIMSDVLKLNNFSCDVKTEPSDDVESVQCCSPLNLKLPSNGSDISDNCISSSPSSEDLTIKIKLQDFFNIPESNLTSIEENARAIRQFYSASTSKNKFSFLRMLATEYAVDHSLVQTIANLIPAAMARYNRCNGHNRNGKLDIVRVEDKLRRSLIPRYQQLFLQLSRLENGVSFLVTLRADVISMLQNPGRDQGNVNLLAMNAVLHNLFTVWISAGSLQLERITWESPCDLLQKICAYEALQSIRTWTDLKKRVSPSRRCFAFTHRCLPREPVLVVHTALTQQISDNIQCLLGDHVPHVSQPTSDSTLENLSSDGIVQNARTAIFYSITSTQKGLQGIELGNNIIKRIIAEVSQEIPSIFQFSSLSPIPGYKDWMLDELNHYINLHEMGEDPEQTLLTEEEIINISNAFGTSKSNVFKLLHNVFLGDSWLNQPCCASSLMNPLMRHCARYLYMEKKRGLALNPVANFHLSNGAELWRLNWLADTSARGVANSFTIMANYRYFPQEMDNNSRNYIDNRVIPASSQLLELFNNRSIQSGIANPRQSHQMLSSSEPT